MNQRALSGGTENSCVENLRWTYAHAHDVVAANAFSTFRNNHLVPLVQNPTSSATLVIGESEPGWPRYCGFVLKFGRLCEVFGLLDMTLFVWQVVQGASLRERLPPATLAHQKGRNTKYVNEDDIGPHLSANRNAFFDPIVGLDCI